MIYDRKIKSLVRSIRYESDCYLDDIEYFDDVLTANKRLENIIDKTHELERYYNKRTNILSKDTNESNKGVDI